MTSESIYTLERAGLSERKPVDLENEKIFGIQGDPV
jgi:hypothetical protein